ncbi:Alpha/Beta hydrolase protein [Dichotomopilus funicola]|uniref:Alpha/Beta hydrolase protein n=1 Tax=Dichotomopilus funicola TaxID=1934379 RepID=A0AAN6V0V5_9PEZI|nr:Alpha/Beta hydrolase protein [Dichotomopilus funicola]
MSSISWGLIQQAELPAHIFSIHLVFKVPLVHGSATSYEHLNIHAELIYGLKPVPELENSNGTDAVLKTLRGKYKDGSIVAYLCGGPGDGNPPFTIKELNNYFLEKGRSILYVDYRGTGLSSPVTAAVMRTKGNAKQRAEYLTHFRQDSIVADLEAIRKCLGGPTFSLLGQSYGGWVAMTYLSFLPGSLKEVWLTGGMPPIGKTPDDTYKALYKGLIDINKEYYKEHEKDKAAVSRIVQWLHERHENGVSIRNGARLTWRGFLTLGRRLGAEGGFKAVHGIVQQFDKAAKSQESKDLSDAVRAFDEINGTGFRLPQRPLYGVMHEAIYCSGPNIVSNWAAQRIGGSYDPHLSWLRNGSTDLCLSNGGPTPYFTSEMIHSFMLEDAGPELEPFLEPANILAKKYNWPALYDTAALRNNTVPVRALMFPKDLFVEYELSLAAANDVRCCKAVPSPKEWLHASIKTNTEEVCKKFIGGIKRILNFDLAE